MKDIFGITLYRGGWIALFLCLLGFLILMAELIYIFLDSLCIIFGLPIIVAVFLSVPISVWVGDGLYKAMYQSVEYSIMMECLDRLPDLIGDEWMTGGENNE